MGVSFSKDAEARVINGKEYTAWTITKDGESWRVIDKNGNGYFDNGDLIQGLHGNKNYLSEQDVINTQYQIKSEEVGLTAEESIRYSKFQDAMAATNPTETTPVEQQESTEKKGFWGKLWGGIKKGAKAVGNFCTKMLPFVPLGLGVAGIVTSWQYSKGNANDTAMSLAAISGMVATTATTMYAMDALKNINKNTYGIDSIGASLPNFAGTVGNGGNIAGSGLMAQFGLEASSNNNTSAASSADMAAVKSLYNSVKSSDITDGNKKWLKDIIEKGEMTDADKEILANIKANPKVSYSLVGDGTYQLDTPQINEIRDIISEYKKANGDNKTDIIPDINKLYETLAKDSLTATEFDDLNKLIKNARAKITEQATKKGENV